MPPKNAKQQRLMGAALAAKRGESKPASKEIKKVSEGMSESQLKEFATKPKGGYKKK